MLRKDWLRMERKITKREVMNSLLLASIPIVGTIAIWFCWLWSHINPDGMLRGTYARTKWKLPKHIKK